MSRVGGRWIGRCGPQLSEHERGPSSWRWHDGEDALCPLGKHSCACLAVASPASLHSFPRPSSTASAPVPATHTAKSRWAGGGRWVALRVQVRRGPHGAVRSVVCIRLMCRIAGHEVRPSLARPLAQALTPIWTALPAASPRLPRGRGGGRRARCHRRCLPAVHAFCQACPAPTHPPPPTTRAFARQACVKRGGDYTGGVRGDISFNGDLGEEGRGGVGWFRRAAGTAGRGGWAKQLSTCRGRGGAGSAGRGGRRWRPLLNIHPPMAVPSAVSAPQLVPYWMPLPWSGTTRLRRRSGSTCSEAWGRAGRAAGAGRGLVAAPCAACCRLPACTSPAHGAHALPAAACLPAPPLPMVLTRFHVLRPTNPQGVLWVGTHGPEPGSGAAEGHAAGAGAGQPPRGAPLHAGACIALHLESTSTQGTMQLVQGNVQSVCALLRHSWMAAVASGTRTGWQAGRPDSLASTPPAQVAPRSAAPCPTLSTHLLLNVHIPACRRHRRRRVGCARAWRPSSARWERSSGT